MVCLLGLSPASDPERNTPATFSGPAHVSASQDTLQKEPFVPNSLFTASRTYRSN